MVSQPSALEVKGLVRRWCTGALFAPFELSLLLSLLMRRGMCFRRNGFPAGRHAQTMARCTSSALL